MATLGNRIRLAREALELSQTDLARRLEVTPSIVNMWEKGVKSPGRINLFKLIDTLRVPPMWLLYGGPLPTPNEKGYIVTGYSPRMVPMRSLTAITPNLSEKVADSPRIPSSYPCGIRSFYIELEDDSNAPDLPRGTLCIFDPDDKAQPTNRVIAVSGPTAAPTIGRLSYEASPGGVVTIVTPTNSSWPAARSDLGELTIIATLTESTRREK